jgi:hypothetical protein
MVDLAAKVKAIHELTDARAANGEVKMLDAALAILQGPSDTAPVRRKRGPYKKSPWYRACEESAAPLEEIVKRAQALEPGCVPGETMEEKMKFVAKKMRGSPSVYREFEDGRWGIRRRHDLYPAHHQSLSAQYDVSSLREVPEG